MTLAASTEDVLSAAPNSLELIAYTISALPSPHLFETMMKSLKSLGTIKLRVRPTEMDPIVRGLTLSGFVNVRNYADEEKEQLETVVDESSNGVQHTTQIPYVVVQGTKPTYAAGASAPLSFLKSATPITVNPILAIASATSNGTLNQNHSSKSAFSAAASKWSLAANDEFNDTMLEDEDSILKREVETVSVNSSEFDCGTSATGKRKACKNCSCGLAEELDKENDIQAPARSAASKGGCGSCGLGDAFRCAGCPYLGKPAFAVTSNGAVKLQL